MSKPTPSARTYEARTSSGRRFRCAAPSVEVARKLFLLLTATNGADPGATIEEVTAL